MPISHLKRAAWLREIVAADVNPDRDAAQLQARKATDAYFRKKKVDCSDIEEWDDGLTKLATFTEQVAPGKMALVYIALKPPVNSRFHVLQQRRIAFGQAMRENNLDAAADNLAYLKTAGWDRLGVVSTEAANDYASLFDAIDKRKASTAADDIADACTLLSQHIESIERRASDHPSRLELPVMRRWLNVWFGDAQRAAEQSPEAALAIRAKFLGLDSTREHHVSEPDALARDAIGWLTGSASPSEYVCQSLALAETVHTLLQQDAWAPLLDLHDTVASLPIERVPCSLAGLRAWQAKRDVIALYGDLLANNPEASKTDHPAMHEKLRFMRYLEGPAQGFVIKAGADVLETANGDDACANLTEYIKRSVTTDHKALLYLHIQDVSVLFHGEHQRDRIGVFFANLSDAYATTLTQASKRAAESGNNATLRDLLVNLRPYCGDGQLTQLHEALMAMNQAELRVPIMETHFNVDERVGEHLRNFWGMQRERYARAEGGFDPENLTVADVARIEADPDYQAHYNNKSSFAAYMRTHWPEFVRNVMELGDQPPSYFDRLLRRGGASRHARNAEFERRLDHQVDVYATLEPDPQP